MSDQHESAISATAVLTGVTNDLSFETLALDIHFSRPDRHPPCGDSICGRCGKSTKREPLEGNLRAGDVTPNEGFPSLGSRLADPYDERVTGNVYTVLAALAGDGITSRDLYLGAPLSWLMKAATQPDRRGGGSNGRKRTDGCSPDFSVIQGSIIRKMARDAA
jgi:hypothetical protein